MTIQLRPYQSKAKQDIYSSWNSGHKNVMAVLPTGAGKTVLFSAIIKSHKGASCAIAHRQELVSQISLALARDKVRHRIIGPKPVVKLCVNLHMMELGQSYYDPSSTCAVAGVDTLVRRSVELEDWLNSVTLCVQDEAHHVLSSNKWGTAINMFPNAKCLGVTATPLRADGKGLGHLADGIFQDMVEGPNMRWLIQEGYLTKYRIFAPPSNFLRPDSSAIGSSGDFGHAKLDKAVHDSDVMGDVVEHYLRLAKGLLGVTFANSVATATEISTRFNEAGVPAAVVSAKTPDVERVSILRRFKNRELLQLVNVDLFGEGFDLPAIEVVSMARATESYALYVQQFGRGLRILKGKTCAIIIDHVGNVLRHGLPDSPRRWTLDRRDSRSKSKSSDAIPVCVCPKCSGVFARVYKECPDCGHIKTPVSRSSPEEVDGDLVEIDPSVLAAMRGDVERVDMPPEELRADLASRYVPYVGQLAGVKRHVATQEAQKALRESISWWAGYQRALDREDSESYRRFFFRFGVDVLSAQALKSVDALELAERVNLHLTDLAIRDLK